MNRITTGAIVSLLIVAAALAWATDHYHSNAVRFRQQRNTASHSLTLAKEAISDMQTRQRDVAALDARYTKELADAKAENDALRGDVAAGRRRLLVNATCPAMPTGKSTSAARVDNAA
ncbi:lysis protein, partial [Salmonella enterica subsp. enterica serovar Wangata]|nr:lysis protein [Salmonella enterica subsp. enterica serovar Wangata]